MDWILGLVLGGALAALDAWLLRWIVRRAAQDKETAAPVVLRGFAARYLITLAVLVFALFVPAINAVGVILPLIAEKGLLVFAAARGKG